MSVLLQVLETDIQTYQGITSSLSKESSRLFKLGYSDPAILKKAQVMLLNASRRVGSGITFMVRYNLL